MNTFFEDRLKLSADQLNVLKGQSVEDPFPVQLKAADCFAEGGDFVISSPTGSGKTLAFILPLLAGLECGNQVVIVAPSSEVVMQITELLRRLLPEASKCLPLPVSGNVSRQAEMLKKRRPLIVVASPSRLLEFVKSNKFKFGSGVTFVADEVDQVMLERRDGGLRELLSRLPEGARVCGFSASAKKEHAVELSGWLGSEVGFYDVEFAAGVVSHQYFMVSANKRHIALVKFLRKEKLDRALVFVNSIGNASFLYNALQKEGVKVACVSSMRDKRDRKKAVRSFQNGEISVLISTDALMRGLDVSDVTVVQYDIARESEIYQHRAGRSGRAGADGRSVTLVSSSEVFLIKKYSNILGCQFDKIMEERKQPSGPLEKFSKKATSVSAPGKKLSKQTGKKFSKKSSENDRS